MAFRGVGVLRQQTVGNHEETDFCGHGACSWATEAVVLTNFTTAYGHHLGWLLDMRVDKPNLLTNFTTAFGHLGW